MPAARWLSVALIAARLTRRDDDKNILRSELAPSTAICATVLLLALAVAYQFAEPASLQGLANYLLYASVPILLFWLLWSHIVVAGDRSRRGGVDPSPVATERAARHADAARGGAWSDHDPGRDLEDHYRADVVHADQSAGAGQHRRSGLRMDGRGPLAADLGQLLTELIIIVSLNLVMAGLLALPCWGFLA